MYDIALAVKTFLCGHGIITIMSSRFKFNIIQALITLKLRKQYDEIEQTTMMIWVAMVHGKHLIYVNHAVIKKIEDTINDKDQIF